ncbi:GNAT family N-acetyltransferase [uncultured Prevotella sp.]|uniref:GNAT family N-acetyltransferase n=1 Tax=uncultured Prevotella sp. TaxID=159272 RepID=UPI0026196082|nr:GNAT family N-acetyltransferase [uncultured Prevotella sp.]
MMRTERITADNVDNAELRYLYESAFPKEERIPYDELKRLLGVMPIDFMTYYDGDMFVGLTMVLNRTDFNWGWYFAVKEELRGRGYGQQILTALKAKYADRQLVIDIESPEQTNCNNIEQRRRRYEFYKRNGFRDTWTAKSFEGIDYTILLLGDGTFTQNDYDGIINELRKFWKDIPKED